MNKQNIYNNEELKKYNQTTGTKIDIWIVIQLMGESIRNKCDIFLYGSRSVEICLQMLFEL